jgi:hypothetical protein
MANDNNLLLIILIGIVLFWISNISTTDKKQIHNSIRKKKSNNKNNIEKFGSTESTYLNSADIDESELINKLYSQHKSQNSNKSNQPRIYSNERSDNKYQELFQKPPAPNVSSKDERQKISKEIATPITNKQPMYQNDNSLQGLDSNKYTNFNDTYMLLPKNNMPDAKFDKVMPTDTRKTLTSGDLLPKDENKDWFQVPNSKFNLMQAVELEVPEIKIGVDTVGQSRKNATYDLRAAPPNPKFIVSPWSNSTIEPDYNTKPLC